MNSHQKFTDLHSQADPLLIANVWNTSSAKAFEKAGYKAVGTSSSAIAYSLGYEDGEKISFDELLFIVKRIVGQIQIPLTVDMEGGYSRDPAEIAKYIKELVELGVVGINLEDSFLKDGERVIQPKKEFASIISYIKKQLSDEGLALFLNIRTDAFLLGLPNPVQETLHRVLAYQECGASGIFVPFISNVGDIKQIVQATELPINVLNMPGLPSFDELKEAGVRRISMGGSAYKKVMDFMEKLGERVIDEQSFSSLSI